VTAATAERSRRPTRTQLKERVAYVIWLIDRRAHKHEIFALLKRRYGVNARTCETYVARAREKLLARAGTTREEQRLLAYAFYESVVRDTDATLTEKVMAQARIDTIFLGVKPSRPLRRSPLRPRRDPRMG
jgi:hypothetical protein